MCPVGKKSADAALMPLPNRNGGAVNTQWDGRIFPSYLHCYRSCVKS
jgi:hypothetical protein